MAGKNRKIIIKGIRKEDPDLSKLSKILLEIVLDELRAKQEAKLKPPDDL